MKDAKCLECGSESNSLLDMVHTDWCSVPNRVPPAMSVRADSTRALEDRLEQFDNILANYMERLFKLEDRVDRVYVGPNPRLDDYERRLSAVERTLKKLEGLRDLDAGAIESHERRLATLEHVESLRRGDAPFIVTPGPVPDAAPGAIHARETLEDVMRGVEERNGLKAVENKLTEERMREALQEVIGQRMSRLERTTSGPNPNHIEDTLVSPIASGEATIVSAADKYWGGGAPKKTKRKRKWWRLWL